MFRYALVLPIALALLIHLSPQRAPAECPPAGSGAEGLAAWVEANCGEGDCLNPATTCNGQFTIELLGVVADGDLVTYEYEVCQIGGQNALSHWSIGLGNIPCLLDGYNLDDLVVAATLNGEEVAYEIGVDPTTQVYGVKFDEGVAGGSCNTFTLTLDGSLIAEGWKLGTGCVVAATKAGNQDITRDDRESPGYACIQGPACVEDEVPPPVVVCETAYAKGNDEDSTCFTEIPDLRANNWGWSIGPLDEGVYVFDLWAGAGQCDTGKGALVGTVTVDYADGVAAVVYEVAEGYVLAETHLWVGNELLPRRRGDYTSAPGQYPYPNEDLEAVEYDVIAVDVEGAIYVAAHAVVCWEE